MLKVERVYAMKERVIKQGDKICTPKRMREIDKEMAARREQAIKNFWEWCKNTQPKKPYPKHLRFP